jgi:hypothetical protein
MVDLCASRISHRPSHLLRWGRLEIGGHCPVAPAPFGPRPSFSGRAPVVCVHALEALMDRRDVERRVLERLRGPRPEREREVLELPLGTGLATALPDLGALPRTTRRLAYEVRTQVDR